MDRQPFGFVPACVQFNAPSRYKNENCISIGLFGIGLHLCNSPNDDV
jgi:hypothetical protein